MNSDLSLCVPIVGPSLQEARSQLLEAIKSANIVEFRLDLFQAKDPQQITELRNLATCSVLFTYREEKGDQDFSKLRHVIESLFKAKPDYIDVNWTIPDEVYQDLVSRGGDVKWILSYHNFERTPSDLEAVYRSMRGKKAAIYKLSTFANKTEDGLRMSSFVLKKNREGDSVIGFCMGNKGQASRILAPLLGSPWSMACLDAHTMSAPGQPTVAEVAIYLSGRKKGAQLFALLGDPVVQSRGATYHNGHFVQKGINAVYLPLQVGTRDLPSTLPVLVQLGFKGLSVTMPLKEEVIRYMDRVDTESASIGAVNTVHIVENKLLGFNTDGRGLLKAFHAAFPGYELLGKKVLVLGAGGFGRAVSYACKQEGALISIWNRTAERAHLAARALDCSLQMELNPAGFDVIIQATSSGMFRRESLLQAEDFASNMIVVDAVSSAVKTQFLEQAEEKGCRTLSGIDIFKAQAVLQQEVWKCV